MKVYALESGDYENRDIVAIYATAEAAMADNPPPGTPHGIPMQAVIGKHVDPTHYKQRDGGWQKADREFYLYDNGFSSDFGCRIIEFEVQE